MPREKSSPEVEELTARVDNLIVIGIGAIRQGRADEALMILQEALKAAQQLPKKEPGGHRCWEGRRMKETEIAKAIGQRLQQAMREADMDRAELARLTGFPQREIENWELGRAVLYPSELMALCHTLDKTPHWLLGWGT